MQKFYYYILGFFSGILNGLFGSGGGLIIIPMLKRKGIDTKKAHATSICIILPISIVSIFFYYINDHINILKSISYIPMGLLGAFVGSIIMKKISNDFLKKIFAIIVIFSSIRLLIK